MKVYPNGPEGTIFSLNVDHPLTEEHNVAFCVAVLPACEVSWSEGQVFFEHRSDDPNARRQVQKITMQFVGVNGGPEAAKEAFGRMIDQMWEVATC